MGASNAQKTLIFQEGIHFHSCHASTILALENGDLLCAYFAGQREKADDVGIWLSRKTGGAWLEPVCIAKDENAAHWNPVLFADGDTVRLVYKVGLSVPLWKSRTRVSLDGGATWSDSFCYPAPHDACGPVRSKPLVLKNGEMLAPNSVETETEWRPFIDISCDGGKSFSKLADIPVNLDDESAPEFISGKGAIQPALWQNTEGVHAVLRTSAGAVYRSDSFDGGKSWSLAKRTSVPNNNSGIETVSDGGDLYLVLNPVSNAVTPSKGVRYPISILKSTDNGETFSEFMQLEGAPTTGEIENAQNAYNDHAYGGRIEYSYPAAVVKDSVLYVSYTYHRRQIVIWEIPL